MSREQLEALALEMSKITDLAIESDSPVEALEFMIFYAMSRLAAGLDDSQEGRIMFCDHMNHLAVTSFDARQEPAGPDLDFLRDLGITLN